MEQIDGNTTSEEPNNNTTFSSDIEVIEEEERMDTTTITTTHSQDEYFNSGNKYKKLNKTLNFAEKVCEKIIIFLFLNIFSKAKNFFN